MDRAISKTEKKIFREFDLLDVFPYTIALAMIVAEIYILHQFSVLTPDLFY
jgi:hypothetical protein